MCALFDEIRNLRIFITAVTPSPSPSDCKAANIIWNIKVCCQSLELLLVIARCLLMIKFVQ